MTSVLLGGTERVGTQVKTLLGHSQSIVYCQSQEATVRDRRFQRVCGRWLAGSEGLSGLVWCRVLPDNAQHNRQISMPPVGSSTGDFESWLKGALEVKRLSLSMGIL